MFKTMVSKNRVDRSQNNKAEHRERRSAKSNQRRGKKSNNSHKVNTMDEVQEGHEADIVEVLPAESEVDLGELEDSDDSIDVGDTEKVHQTRELVRYDTLAAYLSEISRYPHLSREEETSLALRYLNHKDLEAAYKLVTSNLWLVVKIAREYERAARSLLDLIQEGNIGLMEAIKNFDPYRGVRFPSYAAWWIKAYIVRFVIANWRLVKIGTTQAQRKLFFNLKKEREKLEKEGFFPAPKLLAEKLDVRESDVIEMEQRLSSPDISVDMPLSDDSETNLLSILPSGALNAEEMVGRKEAMKLISRYLDEFASTLKDKEFIIFKERMLSEEKATLHELSGRLAVSKERVRQLEERLKEKLKLYLTERMGSSIENFEFD